MSYDGNCEHGVYTHPYPTWERCPHCKLKRDGELDVRRREVSAAFDAYIESGFYGDIDTGVGKLYFAVYRRGR